MNTEPTLQEELQQLIAVRKLWIAETRRLMAVHDSQFDNTKSGSYCSNRRARMLHKHHLDELLKEVAELELELHTAESAGLLLTSDSHHSSLANGISPSANTD